MPAPKLKKADSELLSVIVPAYKCSTIYKDLQNINHYLQALNRPYELICVVDGKASSRDLTRKKAIQARSANQVKVYYYKQNQGKGYALRFGMARARGGIIAFIDAGSDLNARGIGMALEHMKWYNADIIIGSKRHKASKVNYPWQRKIPSFIIQMATRILYRLNVSDTQTGLKVFRREVLEKVLPRLLVKRFAFDLEILGVAKRLGYTRIYESPVELIFNFSSTVTYSWGLSFLTDYLAILYRIYILRYYDDDHHDIWQEDRQLKLRYHL